MLDRLLLTIAGLALLAGCATTLPPPAPGYTRVTLAELHRRPDYWDGRRIEVRGFAVREFENSNVYPNYDAYCDGGMAGYLRAVGVAWPGDLTDRPSYNRRYVLLRGIFDNIEEGIQPDGSILIAGSYSFGPIYDVEIVTVFTDAKPTCSSAPMDQAGWEP